MWLLIFPALAIVGGWLYGAKKVHDKSPPLPHDAPVTPPPLTVDSHGTGVISEPESLAAAAAAAKIAAQKAQEKNAAEAAAKIAQQQSPGNTAAEAAAAAEAVKQQIIDALNTPETDRTPEQLALLLALASLPTAG